VSIRPVALIGPTATGKSDLGIELALRLGGEVINADAMQLYRGMDIGTAKLPPGERRGVAHHLLDVLDVTEAASVAAYQRVTRAKVEELMAAGKVPILVGGSGLYVRAVLDELTFPGTDAAVRARLEAELEAEGADVLHRRLGELDPPAAAAVLVGNARRIVRALEVIEITGRPFTAHLPRPGPERWDTVQIGLDLATEQLDDRIGQRVERMFDAGLVDEVRALLRAGLRDSPTASRAVGYQQVVALLDGGCTPEEAAEDTVRATRRLVRRQRSWFRRDDRIHWLDALGDPVAAALRVLT
jgi:tRNA dimethylallyltransferase